MLKNTMLQSPAVVMCSPPVVGIRPRLGQINKSRQTCSKLNPRQIAISWSLWRSPTPTRRIAAPFRPKTRRWIEWERRTCIVIIACRERQVTRRRCRQVVFCYFFFFCSTAPVACGMVSKLAASTKKENLIIECSVSENPFQKAFIIAKRNVFN